MAEERDIKYTNKDFSDFKKQLVEYAKNYFPDSYNDFSPTSPGMMFIEMASYVGDILSFYQDTQLQETYLTYAKDPKNLFSLAYMMGYKPKTTGVAEAEIDVTQIIDATLNYLPNWEQAAIINQGAVISSMDKSQTSFIIDRRIDFNYSSSIDKTEILIDELDENGNPLTFQLRKKAKATSGKTNQTTVEIGSSEKFKTLTLEGTDIIGIESITDTQGNIWYEVPFLGQDTIYADETNTNVDSNAIPFVLHLQKVPRRFVTRFLSTGFLTIQFGAGTTQLDDSIILPDPMNIGAQGSPSSLGIAYDPSNFLRSSSYGIAPNNTTLTIKYLTGGGISSNVPANSITVRSNITVSANSDQSRLGIDSLFFNNPTPASGGRDGDTVEELRENSLRAFNEQSRTVTLQDYTVRAMSLPSRYGSIAKAFITQDQLTNTNRDLNNSIESNPLALALYVLSYDYNGKIITSSITVKNNLKTYLSEYMLLTDAINIKDAFVINIGLNYEIIVRPTYSSRDVLLNCNIALKSLLHISKRAINQPINLSDLYAVLDRVKGVQTVQKIEIENKAGGIYSQYSYDTKGATRNNVVYPSYDPCIFEIKYPDVDIKGRTTTL
jgi:hypothetical protein